MARDRRPPYARAFTLGYAPRAYVHASRVDSSPVHPSVCPSESETSLKWVLTRLYVRAGLEVREAQAQEEEEDDDEDDGDGEEKKNTLLLLLLSR